MLKTAGYHLIALLFLSGICRSQDTISMMSYNLLNYSSVDGNSGRYIDLRNIIKNANPDVMVVCELANAGAPQYLLDSAFNKAGVGTYSRAVFYDGTDTDNMLFYKTGKVSLKSQKQIPTVLRDISQYLIYKVVASNDTAFIYLHMSHLKANNLPADETQRQVEVSAFCSDIAALPPASNIILAGDMNLKASTEPAFITLSTNACSHVFYDPINQPGTWNNNNAFSKLFTQSTRSTANPGCCGGSTGGLDDRFDLLLTTSTILSGSNKVKYVYGSYKAYGNDNQHMNLAIINAPTNSVVPAGVAQSLFNMSDHLPVMMKLALLPSVNGIKENYASAALSVRGVYESGNSHLGITTSDDGLYTLKIIDMAGKTIASKELELRRGYQTYDIERLNLQSGLYHILLSSETNVDHCVLSMITDQ